MHWPGSKLREKALDIVMKHIQYEDETTQYICIAPMNKVNKELLSGRFAFVVFLW
jgi:cycloartenol synthase